MRRFDQSCLITKVLDSEQSHPDLGSSRGYGDANISPSFARLPYDDQNESLWQHQGLYLILFYHVGVLYHKSNVQNMDQTT